MPSELSRLTHLRLLSLSHNDLTGTLPDLHKLTGLEYVDLGTNQLSGDLPNWINAWSHLKVMGFENNLLAGELPPALAELTELKTLDFKKNLLKGGIDVVDKMPNLEYLYLSHNGFASYIDPDSFLVGIDSIQELDISNNLFYGDVFPRQLLNKPNLKLLDISANALRGSLPDLNSTNSVLEVLEINANGFTGTIPSSIEKLVNLKHLDMQMVGSS